MAGMLNQNDPEDTKRLIAALVIIGLGLIAWQVFFEKPQQDAAQLKQLEATARQEMLEEKLQENFVETVKADRAAAQALSLIHI